MEFKPAQRKKARLRLGISGTSGSGKTWSALEIATGMGGKIAMIDTESGRGELYANDFKYDVMQIDVPFSPDKYIEGIKMAEKNGYDILIIDSLSHAWVGEGGVLSIVEKAGGNTFTNGWRVGTAKQNALVHAIISSPLHIIFTMRSKAEYIIHQENNKSVPKKVGMAPIQREGLEYECTFYIEMSQDHTGFISKDNTKLYDQQYVTPDKKMGENLIDWLNSGKGDQEIYQEKKAELEKKSHQMVDELIGAPTLKDLEVIFKKYYKICSPYDDILSQITSSKETRKKELLQEQTK